MPFEDTKTSEFNKYEKPGKAHIIIYADLECLTQNIGGCKSNP